MVGWRSARGQRTGLAVGPGAPNGSARLTASANTTAARRVSRRAFDPHIYTKNLQSQRPAVAVSRSLIWHEGLRNLEINAAASSPQQSRGDEDFGGECRLELPRVDDLVAGTHDQRRSLC